MKYSVDHDLHIHTNISICCVDPDETPEALLRHALKHGLKTVAVTDHFWDERVVGTRPKYYGIQDFAHISKARPLPQAEGVNLIFGCEADMNDDNVIGVSESRYDEFGFIIIPTTHWHLKDIIKPEVACDNDLRIKTWIAKFDALLDSTLPLHKTGIAHMLLNTISRCRAEYAMMLDRLPADELERLFTKSAEKGLGIEINCGAMKGFEPHEEEAMLRIFRIAKGCGCKFYLGSDAHKVQELEDSIELFKYWIDKLELEEKDKFVL